MWCGSCCSELVAWWELFVEYLADIVLAITIDVVILVVEPQDNVAERGDGSVFQCSVQPTEFELKSPQFEVEVVCGLRTSVNEVDCFKIFCHFFQSELTIR